MFEKIDGHISFLTNGEPILYDFSKNYPDISFKSTWSGEFADVANKYYISSLDKVNITVSGVYFDACEKSAVFSAISDLAEAGANRITVHVPMPATIAKPDGMTVDFENKSKWTREEVISAVEIYYVDDLKRQMRLLKTATSRITNTEPSSNDAMTRFLMQKEYVHTEKQRDPSKIKDYKVRFFIDGYEYSIKTGNVSTVSWTEVTDDTPTISFIFWSFLDKYFEEVLAVPATETIAVPDQVSDLPKITPYIKHVLDQYCNGATSIEESPCFQNIPSIADAEFTLVNNILVGGKDTNGDYILGCSDDTKYISYKGYDDLIKVVSDRLVDTGLKSSWPVPVVKLKKVSVNGLEKIYLIDSSGKEIANHQPIGYCKKDTFNSYLLAY